MSWEQDYDVEDISEFLSKILKMSTIECLLRELLKKKIKVEIEPIIVIQADGMTRYEDTLGAKITIIKNGKKKVYVPKLVKVFTSNGNYGCDTYEYVEENKKIKPKEINQ